MKKITFIFLFTGIAALLITCRQNPTEISRSIQNFDEFDRQAVLDLINDIPNGKGITLNLANDSHYRFLKKQLYMSGANEDTHPQLFKKLECNRKMFQKRIASGENLGNSMLDTATFGISEITSFLATPSTDAYGTSGLLSYPYGSIQTGTISIGMYTNTGSVIGAPGYATGNTYSELTQLGVISQGNSNTPDSVYSLYAYSYLDKNDSLKHGAIKAVTANVVDSIVNIAPVPCTLGQVVQPCNNCCNFNPPNCISGGAPYTCPLICSDNKIVTVCMTRNVPNCTYCNTGLANNFMFPLQGYIKYAGNVNVGSDGKPNHGAFASVTLTRLPHGGGCPAIPLQGSFFNYATVQGNKISWNLSAAAFPNTCLQSGDSVLFQMTIFVTVGTGNTPAFATITNSPNVPPPALRIAPIHVVSGCLAAGTMITMADGKKIAVEDVPMESFVRSSDNRKLQVNYNTTGTEKEKSYRLKTDKGHNLLLTGAHPVITPEGVKLTRDMNVGDHVLTDKGEAVVNFIGRENYDGIVWNLAVSKPGEADKNPGNTTFYANGILVGDHKMQNTVLYKRETREDVLKRLPEEWHADYLNELKRRQH